jgi:hypothetical protein
LPEVGALSADGSRRWDGLFWVPLRPVSPLDELPAPVRRPVANDFRAERRLRIGSAVLAAVVGLVFTFVPVPGPNPGSFDAALNELAVAIVVRALVTFGAMVLILSVGRQGIDLLVLRAMLTAFLYGAAIVALFISAVVQLPIPVTSHVSWATAMIGVGLIVAVAYGPILVVPAAIANLVWYRSFRSLRAQLPVFIRIVMAVVLAADVALSLWAALRAHNFGTVLAGTPAAAVLVMVILLRKSKAGTATPSV